MYIVRLTLLVFLMVLIEPPMGFSTTTSAPSSTTSLSSLTSMSLVSSQTTQTLTSLTTVSTATTRTTTMQTTTTTTALVPSSPLCSSVTAVSNTSLNAFWRDGGNATDFRIHVDKDKSDVNISRHEACQNASQECNITITGLSPGANYSITIFALSYGKENSQSCTLHGNALPSSPLCYSVTAVSNTSLDAYWRDGGNATDFRIHIEEDNRDVNVSKWVACPNVSQGCNHSITGLSPGTNYSITIFALSFGEENSQSCTLHGSALPSSPLCSSVTAVSNTSLNAFWRDGGNATDFRIHVDKDKSDVNISRHEACQNASQECNITITGLSPGTNYSITIFAISYGKENSQSCTLHGNALPSSPLCSSVTAVSNTSLNAFWKDGGNATNFRIHVEEDNRDVNVSKSVACPNVSQGCNHSITGLSPGTNYSITIFAISYGKENSQFCTLHGNALASSPLCWNLTAVSNTSLKTHWQDGGNATDFRIHVDEDNRDVNISRYKACKTMLPDCSIAITGLSPGTNYSITIFAISYGKENNQSCNLHGNALPSSPLCSNVTAVSNTSLNAFWQDGGNATNFRIHVNEENRDVNISKSVACENGLQDCNQVITGLSPGTNYSITIFAISYGKENSQSCTLHGNSLANSPLCSNLTAVSNTSLKTHWQDGGNSTDFRIHITEDNRDVYISRYNACKTVLPDCSITITGLSPGTNYSITIFAISYGKENSQSCTLHGNALPSPPLCSSLKALSISSLGAYWLDGGNATDFIIHVQSLNLTTDTKMSKNDTCFNSSQECSHNITNLIPGAKYNMSIYALSYGIENVQPCSLSGNTIPSKPKEYAILEVTAHNFTVSWTNGTGERDFYRVNYSCRSPNKPNETFTNYTKIKPEENIYRSIYLDPGTFCELQIYAVVGVTETLSIPLVCNLSLHETAPGSVENLKTLNITSTSIRISWTPPSKPNGLIRGYLLTVIENVGYCVEMQSCVQHYDFYIHSRLENYSCQGIEESIDIKMCLLNASTTLNTTSNAGPFLLENLKPHVNYSIWLRAYTLCTGDNVILNATTLSTGPHQPSNINATAISPQNISVTWTSPDLCTGITSYSVIYTEAESSMGKSIANCSDLRKDFGLTECTIGGLEEYWQYNISVQATVEGFLPIISSTVNETTLESVPGPVETLQLTPENNPNKSRSMLVEWKPPRPREKNGVILFYKITYYYKLSHVVEIVLASNEYTILLENLTGGEIYFVNISANTSKGYGEIVQRNATIRSGAPGQPTIPVSKSKVQVSDPTRQIAVDLPVSSFLCNTEYGFVERRGVVVSQYSKATDDPFRGNASDFQGKLLSYRSWRDIRNEDIFPPYRATHDKWKPVEQCGSQARRKRSTETVNGPDVVSFIIGDDADCAGTSQHFCNGYLKPNNEYRVRVFVCTSEGCTESVWSSPIRTENDNTAVIIALSVVLSLLFIFGILVIIVLRTRRMLCFKVKETVDPNIMLSDVDFSSSGSKIKVHRSIPLSNLRVHIGDMHKDSNMGFSSEYKFIKAIEPKHTTDIAQSESCRSKNRYTNILPYDHSRVKLLPIEDEEGSDYINANYIQGYNAKREYIATQGPLPATRDDFWRMVWEQNAEIIVMLTKCMEKGRVKCDKYWPDVNEPVYYGDLIVNVTSESILCDYIIKVIELKLNQTTKKVYHFSFLNWPDMGCPKDPSSLLNFVTAVRTYVKPNFQSPIVVHCSAGVGRTGTFIAIDHLMQHVKDSAEIDIFNLVYEMRNQRSNMVQTEDQYVYIHDSVLEYITDEDDDGEEEPVYENKHMDGEQIYENAAFIKD